MSYKSKYTGPQIDDILDSVEGKQNEIEDLASIRSGAAKGATALQSYTEKYTGTITGITMNGVSKGTSGVVDLGTVITSHQDISGKVDKVSGKQLSTEDFTTALKTKLEGLGNYDDTTISNAVSSLQTQINTLVSGNANDAINSFNEIIAFLDGVQDTQDLSGIIASIEQQIAGKMDKVTLATVATSGSYNDLSNKPTIPSAVTESTVSGWGFTKNTGTYSKPSTGIPKSDLASAVQTSLGKADTALQSYTEQYQGTVQSVETSETLDEVNTTTYVKYVVQTLTDDQKAQARSNIGAAAVGEGGGGSTLTESDIAAMGFTKNTGTYSKPSGGIPKTDLDSSVQASLGKADTALQSYTEQYKGTVTGVKINGTTKNPSSGVVDLGTVITSHQDISGKQDKLVSGTNIKTINSNSILGSGNISVGTITAIQANGTSIATSGTANIPAASTSAYGVTKLSSSTSSTSTALAATASAVKAAYDLANGKQDKLTSGTNIKTINGESILGSGNITISGGSSSGSGVYAEVNHGTSDTTFTLTPNTFHVWDEVSELTLTLGDETSGVANEYVFQFTSGSEPTALTLPDNIKWANDSAPTIAENKIYQVSVLKGLATALEFSNVNLIEFTINNEIYFAEDGMTWQDWVNSSYNGNGYTISGNQVIWGTNYVGLDYSAVSLNDLIIPNANYKHYNNEPT